MDDKFFIHWIITCFVALGATCLWAWGNDIPLNKPLVKCECECQKGEP